MSFLGKWSLRRSSRYEPWVRRVKRERGKGVSKAPPVIRSFDSFSPTRETRPLSSLFFPHRTHHAGARAARDGVAEHEALERVAAVRLPVDHLHQLVVVLLGCVAQGQGQGQGQGLIIDSQRDG